MLKAIFAKHVLSGDIVMLSGGSRITVRLVELIGDSVHLYAVEGGIRVLSEYDVVGLGHRAWPNGVTESEALHSIRMRAGGVWYSSQFPADHTKLRESIEAYELGKPLEEKPGSVGASERR